MKKIIFLIMFLSVFFFLVPLKVFASFDAVISGDSVRIRKGAGTENDALYTVNAGTPITLEDKTLYAGTGCSQKWYKITYKEKTGYVCSKYVKFIDNTYDGINVVDYTSRVNANNVAVRKGPNTSYATQNTLSLGVNVEILDSVTTSNSNCTNDLWYKISYYKNKTGYICAKYVTKKSDITATNEEYAATLREKGFPDSYIPYLTHLHNKYPEWTFIAKNTNVYFTAAVSGEEGKNYMQTKNDNYRTSSTPAEGASWFKINSAVIAFYMDPRNWLTQQRIFMFEKLDYSSEFDDKYPQMIKSIFGTAKLSDDKYTIPMFNAGKINKISPVHIASRIKQEVSPNGSDSTNGVEFTFKGKKYSGYYNFFNIGAYEEKIDGVKYSAVTRGLAYAAKLIKRNGQVWDNIETSIVEGSAFLANGYITKGQGTLYYQKFNVSPDSHYSKYTHQYMTNVQAPATEGNSTYSSYKSAGILSEPFIFEIPVYKNMPEYTSLPDSGDTNNDLKSLSVEGFTLSPDFDEDILTYEVYVPSTTTSVNVIAEASSSKATVTGTGNIAINKEDTDITITVKSETSSTKKYTITVKTIKDETNGLTSTNNNTEVESSQSDKTIKQILNDASISLDNDYITNVKYNTYTSVITSKLSAQGATSEITNSNNEALKTDAFISTGSKITIKLNNETKTYTFIVRGDTSGDGQITSLDLLQVLKHIKGDKKLKDVYLRAGDTSLDSVVTSLDLLQILKHIKGDKRL